MKQVEACLDAREDRESSFHHCGSPVRLVHARLCAGKTWQSRFNLRVGAVKHVQSCLNFQGRSRKQFSQLWRSCDARASLFMCVKDLITPF